MLFLVPTPIGNLGDITERAREVLSSADVVLAEDTRTTGKLLNHLGLSAKLQSFHAHNEHARLDGYLDLLRSGSTVALVSDAGTPAISDPGFLLVRACREEGIAVSCLPGPTAFVPALAASGLPCDRFHFEGFLPQKKGRNSRLEYLATLPHTFALYESPFRLVKCLAQLIEHCGADRPACVAREISKLHEDVRTDTLQQLHDHYAAQAKVKGEIVVVVGPQGSFPAG
jgi:16S rRNA (cytidine1402-2'-O)-methyltransferase